MKQDSWLDQHEDILRWLGMILISAIVLIDNVMELLGVMN